MEDVQETLGQLTRVTIAIRKAGDKSHIQKADASFNNNNPQIRALRRHLEILLLAKPRESGTLEARVSNQGVVLYSSAFANVEINSNSLSKVMKRLIEANLKRRNLFLYAQMHADKLSSATQYQSSTNRVTLQIRKTLSGPSIIPPAKREKSDASPLEIESATTATVVQDTIIMPAQHTMQPTSTVISATTSRVQYPKPPLFNRDQRVFQCPCCCQMLPISVSRSSQWK